MDAIFSMLSAIQVIIIILLLARYVFQEPKVNKNSGILFGLLAILLCLLYWFWGEDGVIGGVFLCPGLYIAVARKKRRIRGLFMPIPIVGIGFGLLLPFSYTVELLVSSQKIVEFSEAVLDFITILLLLIFMWRGKQWRIRFEQELQYRHLRKWEKRLLVYVGWLLIIVYCCMIDAISFQQLSGELKFLVVMTNIVVFILTLTVMGLVLRGNKGDYYEGIAKLNEHYLEMELQHFEAYQLTQKETRRIQHDMKHHIACLQYLCQQGNVQEVHNYLNDIEDMLQSTSLDVNCGNALTNSICTHKKQLANQKGIRFEVLGRMPEQIGLKPIDLCTILANALDNAIEAVENLEEAERWIRFEISSQGNMLLFRFSNPVNEQSEAIEIGRTTKKDVLYHGFGLQNIKYTVEKYHGQMLTEIDKGDKAIYTLSVVVGVGDGTA